MKKVLAIVLCLAICLASVGCVKTCAHEWGTAKVTAATCKAAGSEVKTCSLCGEEDKKEVAKLTTHRWNAGNVTTQPTCKDVGVRTFNCIICETTKTEDVDKKTVHTYVEDAASGVAATCTVKGSISEKCSVCDNKRTLPTNLDPANHNVAVAACKLHCADCGTGKSHGVAACGVAGHYECDGGLYLNHAECTIGGSSFLTYTLNEAGTAYTVSGITGTLSGTKLVVPAFYNGKPVTAISEGLFNSGHKDNSEAFKTFLKTVVTIYIPETVTSVNKVIAFLPELVNVKLPTKFDGKYYDVLCNIAKVDVMVIADGVTALEGNSFMTYSDIKQEITVYLPKSVMSIVTGGLVLNKNVTYYYEGSVAEWEKLIANTNTSFPTSIKSPKAVHYNQNNTDAILAHNQKVLCLATDNNHAWGAATTTAATCSVKGTSTAKCTVCDTSRTQETALNPANHNVAASACALHCTACSTGSHGGAVCDVAGHYECDGGLYLNHAECTIGGSSFLTYTLNEAGTAYTVSGITGTLSGTKLVVPAFHEGKPVTAIKEGLFNALHADNSDAVKTFLKTVVTIYIPETVTSVNKVIAHLPKLVNVKLPNKFEGIYHDVLCNIEKVDVMVIANGVTSLEGNSFMTYSGINQDITVYLPKTVTKVVTGGLALNDKVTYYYEGSEAEWNVLVANTNTNFPSSVKSPKAVHYNQNNTDAILAHNLKVLGLAKAA